MHESVRLSWSAHPGFRSTLVGRNIVMTNLSRLLPAHDEKDVQRPENQCDMPSISKAPNKAEIEPRTVQRLQPVHEDAKRGMVDRHPRKDEKAGNSKHIRNRQEETQSQARMRGQEPSALPDLAAALRHAERRVGCQQPWRCTSCSFGDGSVAPTYEAGTTSNFSRHSGEQK